MANLAHSAADLDYMRLALSLARRGYGTTSPNPMVGAVLVKAGRIIGRGWHHRAGEPHAEIEALRDMQRLGHGARGATLYVTLEPCSTHGRTPPCTEAILQAGIERVVVGATDPNPAHAGAAFTLLSRAGVEVRQGVLALRCEGLNQAFNHWIVQRQPFVTVKAAMTLDGKIATAAGQSKWITGEQARAYGMKLRQGADALLVGINTILSDDPSLTFRPTRWSKTQAPAKQLRRIILDSQARTPLRAKVVTDAQAALTTIVVSRSAQRSKVRELEKYVRVLMAPSRSAGSAAFHGLAAAGPAQSTSIDLPWLLQTLGAEEVTSLLVEGGGELNASFLMSGLAHRIAFFYAPKILGGSGARRAVAGEGAHTLEETLDLEDLHWRVLGEDWLLTGRVRPITPVAPATS